MTVLVIISLSDLITIIIFLSYPVSYSRKPILIKINTEMKIFYKAFTFLLLFSLLTGCSSDTHKEHSEQTAEQSESVEAEPEIFEASGRVVSIPPSKRNFIVRHGDIPGFMNAMTMAFSLQDTALLQHVEPGDSIRFEIESQGSSAVVISLDTVEE